VKEIALSIYDGLAQLHKLNSKEREILEAAALLHDCGYHISHDQHHKHSYYMIRHCIMPGFTNNEAELIANIARYHRKSHPKKKHENFAKLSVSKKKAVRILAGILRIAEGIDRRQLRLINAANVEITDNLLSIALTRDPSKLNPDIELWGALRRKPLLEETLNKPIDIRLENPE
jgi:exopolyphosphatase/guanosine-5'-triphosphate,3'-diphosphate pyrophosphatase